MPRSRIDRFDVRPFRPGDLDAAASLLAAAHARAAVRAPGGAPLGARYFDAASCRGLIEPIVSSRRASAVVAEADGRVFGFLAGERQLFAPEEFASIYAEPRSVIVPLQGHAVAGDVDAHRAYEAMYAWLAKGWVGAGFFVHNVSASCLDTAAHDAFVALGFGRKSVCALRSTEPSDRDVEEIAGIVVEEIRGRDDEMLEIFHRRLMTYQTSSPMFWPYTGEADVKVRTVRRDAMLAGQGVAYLAKAGGVALGSLLFVPAVFLSPLLVSDRMTYLWEGFVDESRRANGVGSLLLSHALRRLRERGVAWCTLHYVSSNPGGGRFWPSRGFEPLEATLHRHVDERIGWARGPRS